MRIRVRSPVMLVRGTRRQQQVGQQDVFSTFPLPFRGEIEYVQFGYMWRNGRLSDDPFLQFGIHFWNYSPYSIELAGVEGRTNINNTPITQLVRLPIKPTIPRTENAPYSLSIERVITKPLAETLEQMRQSGDVIPFQFGGLVWIGEAVVDSGRRGPPPGISCAGHFEVVGPHITHDHAQAYMQAIRLAGRAP